MLALGPVYELVETLLQFLDLEPVSVEGHHSKLIHHFFFFSSLPKKFPAISVSLTSPLLKVEHEVEE
ncbi:DnaJ-like protein subfamily C member 10 [Frankliniella fusca]|uniref:DnaJ-like protein subfamily C member 10 n=1 Tax=Frankliniella fusca TaxID=407009 RepID=A0AAE1H4I6_9NEOP|nr:DnaJ-like protein subfamily C member 10 [Frankliniella fusca]